MSSIDLFADTDYLHTDGHSWLLRAENGTPYPMDAPLLYTDPPKPDPRWGEPRWLN